MYYPKQVKNFFTSTLRVFRDFIDHMKIKKDLRCRITRLQDGLRRNLKLGADDDGEDIAEYICGNPLYHYRVYRGFKCY